MESSGPRTARQASPDLFSLFAHEIQRPPRTSGWQKYPRTSDRAPDPLEPDPADLRPSLLHRRGLGVSSVWRCDEAPTTCPSRHLYPWNSPLTGRPTRAALGRLPQVDAEPVQAVGCELAVGEFGEADVPVEPGRPPVAPGDDQVHSAGPLAAQGFDQCPGQLAPKPAGLQTWHQV